MKGSDITDIIAGLLFGVLSGMGVGGGGLLVIYLTGVLGVEQRIAQGMNLCFFIVAAMASLLVHLRVRKLNYTVVFLTAFIGALFSFLGSSISVYLPSDILRQAFGVFIAVCGAVSLVKTLRVRRKK